MLRSDLRCLYKTAIAGLLLGATALLHAQDYPTLGGSDARAGLNLAPATGPGLANLTWWLPLVVNGQFYRQIMSPEVTQTNGSSPWAGYGQSLGLGEAEPVYVPGGTGNATEDNFSGYTAYVSAAGSASDYLAATSVASTTDPTQPAVPLTAGTLDSVAWKIEPANASNRTPGNYALYTWITTGPTQIGGNFVYPARYQVYTIQYAGGQTYTDIVDTYLGGVGWVRLGGGGAATNRTFQYDGTNPIVVTEYNTVPRNSLGVLEDTPGNLVYADAIQAAPLTGSYTSSPIVSSFTPFTPLGGVIHVVSALNAVSTSPTNTTITQGVVMSNNYNDGSPRWHWSPTELSTSTYVMNCSSAGTAAQPGWTATATAIGQKSSPYEVQAITNTLASATDVVYTPGTNLPDGYYTINMWVPGNGGGFTFAQNQVVQIDEGTTITTVTVNCSTAGGWVQLGARRFAQNNAASEPLTVHVTNYSASAADSTATAFTDSIQFVGQENLAINSTPVQANCLVTPLGGGTPVATAVTLVAAEDGRIYCLDSTGNGHGGTFVYWTYPSLPSVSPDPNQVAGIDGPGPTAVMPTTFNLSSAVVETVGGHPYLYVGSQNGRVYAIDMEGRGDTTTTRLWTYPDDYPAVPVTSLLGPISGSLAYVNDGTLAPSIIVPTAQGRIYCIDAAGTPANKTTFVHWAFPGSDLSETPLSAWSSNQEVAGDAAWAAPANAQTLDGNYASSAPNNSSGSSGYSQQLEGLAPTLFNNIPPTAKINGIQVIVYRFATQGSTTGSTPLYIRDNEVQLIKNGAITGSNHADTTDNWPTSPPTPVSKAYGGETDLWGSTWTPADFNANFGVEIRVAGNGNTTSGDTLPIANIDYVQVRVYYTSQTPLGQIVATPTVAFGDVYFGTLLKQNDTNLQYSGFFAVNEDTGIPDANWVANHNTNVLGQFNGTPYWNLFTLGPTDTGNGTCSVITTSTTTPPTPGVYTFTFTNATTATGVDPNGNAVANLTVGAAYNSAGLNFTITAGSSAFVAGDTFTITVGVALDNFESGAVAIPAAVLNTFGANQSDSIVVMNDNDFLTSFYADGPNAGKIQWTTNMLGASVNGSLTYAPVTVYDNSLTGSQSPAPLVMVPTADGRFDGMFALNDGYINDGAQPGQTPTFGAKNVQWNRQAWEYVATAPVVASIANGDGFMLAADTAGILYAFSNTAYGGSGTPPGYSTMTANNPASAADARDFLYTKVGFVSAPVFAAAQNGTITQAQLAAAIKPTARAFDWGETLYVAIYNFPYQEIVSGLHLQPPTINLTFSSAGQTAGRTISVQSRGGLSGANTSPVDGALLDGWWIQPYALQNGGVNALPPGVVNVAASISTQGVTTSGLTTAVQLTQGLGSSFATFAVANPIALVVNNLTATWPPPNYDYQIGYYDYPQNPADTGHQMLVNGNPSTVSTANDIVTQLMLPGGVLAHNSSGTATFQVIDRSVLPLLRGPGVGLTNVMVQRSDLAWTYPSGSAPTSPIVQPLPSFLTNFEDYPINLPNDSLDYPDILADNVSVVSNPNANPQNPAFQDSSLIAVSNASIAANPVTTGPSRTLNPTPFQITLNIPSYQPTNMTYLPDSSGSSTPPSQGDTSTIGTEQYAGYDGLFTVFVDSYGNQTPTLTQNSRDAYRTFSLVAGVPPDFRFYSSTPNVDLGSLATGAGLPLNPANFVPDNSPFTAMFQPFNVTNVGNVNLLNLQVARMTINPTLQDVQLYNNNQREYDWLDAATHVSTDIDAKPGFNLLYPYLPTAPLNDVGVLQKPRVGDRSGTTMTRNPVRRANGALGAVGGPFLDGSNVPAPAPPRITMLVPFGVPVGTYSTMMQIVEGPPSQNDYQVWDPNNANFPTPLSNPGFTLTWKSVEAGMTSKPNLYGDVLFDNFVTASDTFLYTNGEPGAFRDASGALHVAFSSSRPSFTPPSSPAAPASTLASSLFIGSMNGVAPTNANRPLFDLNGWQSPTGGSTYFSQDAGPYPGTAPATVFGLTAAGYSANAATTQYNAPAFPANPNNPFAADPFASSATSNGNPYMVFTGRVQVATGNATINDDKIFISQATPAGSGALTLSGGTYPLMLPEQATPSANTGIIGTTTKSRPTIVQVGQNATVFYGSNGAGHGQLNYATFNGSAWTANSSIPLPNIFDYVGAPDATARVYEGVTQTNLQGGTLIANGQDLYEISFPAKLAGASKSDIYMGRIMSNGAGVPFTTNLTGTAVNGWLDLTPVSDTLVAQGGPGVFRAQGIDWDTSQRIQLVVNGTLALDTAPASGAPTSYQVDQTTGTIAADNAAMGGKVYLNPNTGTVRFIGGAAPTNVAVTMLYTPRFLRVSSGAVSASYPTVLYDNRVDSNLGGWLSNSTNTLLQQPAFAHSDRYDFLYSASSTGAGQAARVYMSTFRFGIKLPEQIQMTTNQAPASITVTGANGDYQVDPVNARIYFTDVDEGNTGISVTYTGVSSTGATGSVTVGPTAVSLIPETAEAAVPIDNPVDEGQLTAFLDPFDQSSAGGVQRPGMIWLFWTSTRNGGPDVFFETIAPNFTPLINTK
jgi:hypothetical protein